MISVVLDECSCKVVLLLLLWLGWRLVLKRIIIVNVNIGILQSSTSLDRHLDIKRASLILTGFQKSYSNLVHNSLEHHNECDDQENCEHTNLEGSLFLFDVLDNIIENGVEGHQLAVVFQTVVSFCISDQGLRPINQFVLLFDAV